MARLRPWRSEFLISHSFHHWSQIKDITSVVQCPLSLVVWLGCVLSWVFQAHPNLPRIICSHPICSCWLPISSNDAATGTVFVGCPSNTALSLDTSSCCTSGPVWSSMSFVFKSLRNCLLQFIRVAAWHFQKLCKYSLRWRHEGHCDGYFLLYLATCSPRGRILWISFTRVGRCRRCF